MRAYSKEMRRDVLSACDIVEPSPISLLGGNTLTYFMLQLRPPGVNVPIEQRRIRMVAIAPLLSSSIASCSRQILHGLPPRG